MLARFFLGIYISAYLRNQAVEVYYFISMASIVTVAYILVRRNDPYASVWILLILIIPVYGLFLYLFFGRSDIIGTRNRDFRASIARGQTFLVKDPDVYAGLGREYPHRKRIAGYLGRKNQPLYANTGCEYYALGDQQFEKMLEDMENAERFIFLEYFIIRGGVLWDRMRDILIRKADQGVEIRVMVDDIGCVLSMTRKMENELRAHNIQLKRFNNIHGFFSRYYFNYRNHRKIAVIDGYISHTGGTNISDEYINAYPRFGHWKDNAVRLEGDAVWGVTVSFLQMWDGETKTVSDYGRYRPAAQAGQSGQAAEAAETGAASAQAGTQPAAAADTPAHAAAAAAPRQGYFQPFFDGPKIDADNIAKDIYKTFIYNAKNYVYITTPYLVLDAAMFDALCTAAKGGTDVRVVAPKIWDKWFVHMVTLSNYKALLEAGVRVYEYTPGFMHAKTILSDDDHAIIGTINMDYRSFYLHYENGVWICGAPAIDAIKQDLMHTFDVSEEILLEDWRRIPLYEKCLQRIMRLFSVVF